MSNDNQPDGMKIIRVADRRYAIFTKDGDYLATLPYDEAMPLINKPEARREFLAEHVKDLEINSELLRIQAEKLKR